MATFWAFKTLNSALWTTSTIWGWGHWMFWGNPESAELRMAKQNKERLDKMESKLDQMWAINAGMSPILPMTESLVIVNQDQTTYHKHHAMDLRMSSEESLDHPEGQHQLCGNNSSDDEMEKSLP